MCFSVNFCIRLVWSLWYFYKDEKETDWAAVTATVGDSKDKNGKISTCSIGLQFE